MRSSLFLLPTPDGSRELSGVYSCIVEDQEHLWLFTNHVVAVIHNSKQTFLYFFVVNGVFSSPSVQLGSIFLPIYIKRLKTAVHELHCNKGQC